MKKRKNPIEEVTFTDNLMFQSVMEDKAICKDVLEMILEIPIRTISYPDAEHDARHGLKPRSARFDIYVEDEEGRQFDVEMQNAKRGDLAKRARYYQSLMDSSSLGKGIEDYNSLPDCIIIFLCNGFNPFEKEAQIYKIESTCRNHPGAKYEDGAHKVFLCTEGNPEEIPFSFCR